MSSMKTGFSTLNRWLGKKNKDKNTPSSKLSKSSTNLSVSSNNINETSQLEYNRITPLPAATSNAPFEQTFRITVLLPKDQLYVARLGARVPLSKLLELVCDNKLLDMDKYEFRNPVDASQVYSCDLSIGAVGLSEIRLCHKSDSYDSFNRDEVIKLHRTSIIRDSLSSSEFSGRHSKHTTKTASPYSSNNSLNSMDSTGMNYTRTPVAPPASLAKSKPAQIAAPPRKKRAAPRPPSQTAIPEKTEKATLIIPNGNSAEEKNLESLQDFQAPTRKDYYVSTPNLASTAILCDYNCNNKIDELEAEVDEKENCLRNVDANVEQKNARNVYRGSVQNLPSQFVQKLPEPSPRKRIIQIKKKSAPTPPNRDSYYAEDNVSLASSITTETPETPTSTEIEEPILTNGNNLIVDTDKLTDMPKPAERETNVSNVSALPLQASTPLGTNNCDETVNSVASYTAAIVSDTEASSMPKPVPRITTTTLLNSAATSIESDLSSCKSNVSKVMLNRTPTPEPRSLDCQSADMEADLLTDLAKNKTDIDEYDNVSKQADSGIGEPVPSPLPDSLPSDGSTHECKSTFESSSDDDDMVKVYNFKLGKTVLKPSLSNQAVEEINILEIAAQTDSGEVTPAVSIAQDFTPNLSDTASWNFSIPISPPANFADNENVAAQAPDTPITPNIKERPKLNFEALNMAAAAKHNEQVIKTEKPQNITTPVVSPMTPMHDIVDELSTLIQEKKIDSLIKKPEEKTEIEAAKPNTLTNFSIATIAQPVKKDFEQSSTRTPTNTPETTPEFTPDEEKLYRKRSSLVSNSSQSKRKSIGRADSFHSTVLSQTQNSAQSEQTNVGLNSRSSSHLCLTKLEQNGLNNRRSSSELSIGESPSLQSLEVIKTILNSRKNSLANNNGFESETAKQTVSSDDSVPEFKPKIGATVENYNKTQTAQSTQSKDTPKLYRYSGPPSINFSTWSERPKSQVAIKNEGDYIFGGKNANSRASTMSGKLRSEIEEETFIDTSLLEYGVASGSVNEQVDNLTPTKRMGIPEKEYRIAITVKPLKDVTYQNTETSQPTAATNTNSSSNSNAPIVATKPNFNAKSNHTNSSLVSRTAANFQSNTSTLPRAATNRFSTPVLRSTSITQLESKKPKSAELESSSAQAPFGQNTLRKTGLKEKILAKEEEAQKKAKEVTPKAVTEQRVFVPQNSTPSKTLQSAKLELKLKKSTSVFLDGSQTATTASTATSIKSSTPKSAPATVFTAPPPPPKPATSLSVPAPKSVDQRDQLLAAIRNFNKDKLQRK